MKALLVSAALVVFLAAIATTARGDGPHSCAGFVAHQPHVVTTYSKIRVHGLTCKRGHQVLARLAHNRSTRFQSCSIPYGAPGRGCHVLGYRCTMSPSQRPPDPGVCRSDTTSRFLTYLAIDGGDTD